jgi:hypothetical protein
MIDRLATLHPDAIGVPLGRAREPGKNQVLGLVKSGTSPGSHDRSIASDTEL